MRRREQVKETGSSAAVVDKSESKKSKFVNNGGGRGDDQMRGKDDEKEKAEQMKAKLSKRLYPSLPSWEIAIWSGIWTFSCLYAIYHVYPLSRKYYSYLADYDLGTSWFGSDSKYRRDFTDSEWEVFSNNMSYTLPWFVIHFIGSQFLRKSNKALLPIFNALLSLIYFLRNFGLGVAFSMLIHPAIYFVSYLTGLKIVVWAASLGTLLSLNGLGGPFFTFMSALIHSKHIHSEEGRNVQYMCHVTWAWINARCLSFCLDKIDGVVKDPDNSKLDDFIDMVCHSLYLPSAVSGPIIVYRKFHKGMRSDYRPWTMERLSNFVMQICRYAFWWFFIELSLHFFHQNAFKYSPHLIEQQDTWTVAGVGLAVSHFFHLKYVIFYGLPFVLAFHDGIEEAPRHPCCVARIYSYRDMWRFFDAGLYDCLILHIYIPIMSLWKNPSTLVKFFSSSIVFLYIYVWHGLQSMIAYWALFNYITITLESIGQIIGSQKGYQSIERSLLSPQGRRRFHALLCAPLLLGSILANFYFLLGPELARICSKRAMTDWPVGTPIILFIVYAMTQFCIEVKNWKISNELHGFKLV